MKELKGSMRTDGVSQESSDSASLREAVFHAEGVKCNSQGQRYQETIER